MRRWNAYFGQPVTIDELLFKTAHGLIDQSLHAWMGVETTNGDGFGLGRYGTNGGRPGRYRSITPAWSDVWPVTEAVVAAERLQRVARAIAGDLPGAWLQSQSRRP